MNGSSSTSAAAASNTSVTRLSSSRISSCGAAENVSSGRLPSLSRYTSLFTCGKKSTITRVRTPSSSHSRNTSSMPASCPLSTREDDFVDHMLFQQLRQLATAPARDRSSASWISPGESSRKPSEPNAVRRRLLQTPAQFDGPLAGAHDHDEVRGAELPPHPPDQPRGIDPEQAQQHPGVDRKEQHERAAQIEPRQILRQHQAGAAQRALPEGIAQHHRAMRRIEPLVHVQPVADGHPAEPPTAATAAPPRGSRYRKPAPGG